MEVKIGGTTCLDYIEKGKHKGGNDESVIGICKTQAIENPAETLKILLSI